MAIMGHPSAVRAQFRLNFSPDPHDRLGGTCTLQVTIAFTIAKLRNKIIGVLIVWLLTIKLE